MSNYSIAIRNYRSADFDNYVRLLVDAVQLDRSNRFVSTQRLAEDLGRPQFAPEKDLFVAEIKGKIIGYISVNLEREIRRAVLDCWVHPQHRKKGTAMKLFARVRKYAAEAGANVLQISTPESNVIVKSLLSHLGFQFIRRFFELRLDIYNIPLPFVKAGPFLIRELRHGEEDQLTKLQNRSFAGTWGFNPNTTNEIVYHLNRRGHSPQEVIIIFLKDTPVAYCWTKVDPEANAARGESKGRIHMLGVDPAYQKKGIGKIVLSAGLQHLKRQDIHIVELTADSKNPRALSLYDSAGFELFSKTEWYEKKLDSREAGKRGSRKDNNRKKPLNLPAS